MDLAEAKALAVVDTLHLGTNLVVGADTIVVLDGRVLGKPSGPEEARKMLTQLSGRSHQVLTGVCLLLGEKKRVFFSETIVTFHKISKDLLEAYIATGESLDKAGAYGIQGAALSFVSSIQGSYSNVVGLPVDEVLIAIKDILGKKSDETGEWRECFTK